MGYENIIELNGRRFDAATGAYLGESHTQPIPAVPPKQQSRTIDGVIRPVSKVPPQPVPRTSTHHTQPAAAKQQVFRHAAKHTEPHHPERPKTLMRHVVKKPQTSLKPAIKTQTPAEVAAAPASSLAPKRSATYINPIRLERARQAHRHQQVQHFGVPARHGMPAQRQTQPALIQHPVTRPVETRKQPADIFEAALARATSHEQPTPKLVRQRSRRRRILQTVTAVAVVLIVGGFVAWIQRPHIELRIASFQAGFQASMPEYQLEGYERSPIRNEHGQVVMSYHFGSNHYQITQQPSNWNSQALYDGVVAGASTEPPKIIQSKGRVVYVYGSNASWVDRGVRYDITGNAPLTPEDIRAVIDSM